MVNDLTLQADDYTAFLQNLKQRIEGAQIRAVLSVNHELVLLYWQIGRDILARQQQGGWGAKIIDQLSRDLRATFPELKGFSRRNLTYMRAFAEAWSNEAIVQEPLAQLTWYHNITLLEKVGDADERLWYAHQAIQAGWSRNVLVHQIESGLYKRQGRALTNFDRTLLPAQSDLLAAIDASERHANDQPSIGLILCKGKNQVIVEYALRDMHTPIGVAEYRLTQALPEEWKGSLPTIEELERTLGDDE